MSAYSLTEWQTGKINLHKAQQAGVQSVPSSQASYHRRMFNLETDKTSRAHTSQTTLTDMAPSPTSIESSRTPPPEEAQQVFGTGPWW